MTSSSESQNHLLELADRVLVKNYRQPPFVIARGQGVQLWDTAGRRYLDLTAGIAVCCLGHSHPALTRAIATQAETLVHVSNLFFIDKQIEAAAAIVERCFADRVFFCNSGAEANEAAIKLARRYQHVVKGEPERQLLLSTHGSFHGRSVATVSITGQEKYRQGFGPMFGPVEFVTYGDLAAAETVLASRKVCAVIVEPIQAEGGIVAAPDGYLAGLRRLCNDTGTLLIFDEVQTGIGRTGQWFGHQCDNVAPDVMTLAKALGGGVPVGAVAATEEVAAGLAFREGGVVAHASTFGGNPLACAAVCAVFATVETENLLENCRVVGAHLGARLQELVTRFRGICEGVRGRGLLQGLSLNRPAAPTVIACRERGVLLSVAGGSVVRFAPALTVTKADIDEGIAVLASSLEQVAS